MMASVITHHLSALFVQLQRTSVSVSKSGAAGPGDTMKERRPLWSNMVQNGPMVRNKGHFGVRSSRLLMIAGDFFYTLRLKMEQIHTNTQISPIERTRLQVSTSTTLWTMIDFITVSIHDSTSFNISGFLHDILDHSTIFIQICPFIIFIFHFTAFLSS